jgi:hypothetical protein
MWGHDPNSPADSARTRGRVPTAVETLDEFFGLYLGRSPGDVRRGEVLLIASERRLRPEMGYGSASVLWAVLSDERLVVSVQPALVNVATGLVQGMTVQQCRQTEWQQQVVRTLGRSLGRKLTTFVGPIYYCTQESLRPWRVHPCRPVLAEEIPKLVRADLCDPFGSLDESVREGTCFAAYSGPQAVSVCGTHEVPHLERLVGDMNVPGTLPAFRRQGFGKVAVFHSTDALLRLGKSPVYTPADDNPASQRTALAVGYQEYGWQFKVNLPAE